MPPDLTDPLLLAAAALVAEGAPVTVAAVATRAGVGRGVVYRRYPDRDALLAALAAAGHVAPPEPDARERILDAVGRCLRRSGFAATTIEAVAAEAGVGVVTVYRRFTDRRGLFSAFVAERSPRRLASTLDEGVDLETGLRQIARETLTFLRGHPELAGLIFGVDPEAAELFAEVRASSTSFRSTTARFLARHLPDVSPRALAAFHGMVTSIAWITDGDVDADADFVVTTFLRGVPR